MSIVMTDRKEWGNACECLLIPAAFFIIIEGRTHEPKDFTMASRLSGGLAD